MELLRNFIITLVSTLILIVAVELIAPDNDMKKYLKFILGLMLTVVILNPILKILTGGEEKITNSIVKFSNLREDQSKESSKEKEKEISNLKVQSFQKNLDRNTQVSLKNEFKKYNFKCESKCEVDFDEMKYKILSIKVYVSEKGIKSIQKIDKVDVGKDDGGEESTKEEYKEIKKYLAEELDISKDKIKIYEE